MSNRYEHHNYQVFCDSLQEGMWFTKLHPDFHDANLIIIPNRKSEQIKYAIDQLLQYDRPDIILKDNDKPIFVLERTVEVPSGHNVGQRYGRLVAAAKERIPVVYFAPYMAYKHGGKTAGPRYVNLRVFFSLKIVSDYYNTAITTINWPVDSNYEVLKTPIKDQRLKEYMELFLGYYHVHGMSGLTEYIKNSGFQREQYNEQRVFAEREIQNPKQYDTPPDSVEIIPRTQFEKEYCRILGLPHTVRNILLYHVGMKNIRSDPYTGMAALYHYLYGQEGLIQILHFPNIYIEKWKHLRANTKTYRMYKEFCAGILFADGLVLQRDL